MKTILNILKSRISIFILISFIPVAITTFAVFFLNITNIFWLRMGWNYFLAVIPVYMALFAEEFFSRNKTIPAVIFSGLWLLFFPNSAYMLTDYKYLSYINFETWEKYNLIAYHRVIPWVLLGNLVVCITLGVLAGLISLDIMHNIMKNKFSTKTCWVIITAINAVSAFGVYIGRFARLNSWDIINPLKILRDTLSVMTPFAVIFIAIFTVVPLFLYALYRNIKYHSVTENK